MKSLIAVAIAVAAIVVCSAGTAQAQTQLHRGGFPYPGYTQQGFGGTSGFFGGFQIPREQPPYFAQFPPVYYSHAVKRPYGVSPYAAPAGVMPVEMKMPAPVSKPLVINNPYFGDGEAVKIEVQADKKVKTEAKPEEKKVVGWQANPFFKPQLALN